MAFMDLNIGGGLVEIAALATLIGATTAQSLVLGSRGAAGLPFAAISIFGSPFLIKACVSACTPSWLRETMGVKDALSDAAVGSSVRMGRTMETGVTQGHIAGASVILSRSLLSEKGSQDATSTSSPPQYVYTFDEYTSAILRNCMSAEHGAPARFVRYVRTSQWKDLRRRQNMIDCLSLCLSLLKLVESFTIWYYGSTVLALLTMTNWAWFFAAAIMLQLAGLSREHSEYFDASDEGIATKGYCYDYLAGELPSVQTIGQNRKVIFNVPPSVRGHISWRLTWAFGAFVCVGSLIATYAFIGTQPKVAAAVWLGFQVLWLVVRSVFFHLSSRTEGTQHGVPKLVREWELGKYGFRILTLASAVSRYQTLLHPRMPYCYTKDMHDPSAVYRVIQTSEHLFDRTRIMLDVRLEELYGGQVTTDVEIKAVIGDTLLSSIAWLMGSPHTSMDLYDCCLVVLGVDNRTLLIPSVRVLSGHVKEVRQMREEVEIGAVGEHTPKGVANDGIDIGWVFWIPLDADRWLYYVGDLDFIGKQKMEVLSSADVTKRLSLADLFVSLRDVHDVNDVLKKSRIGGRLLTDLLRADSTTVKQDVPPPYQYPSSSRKPSVTMDFRP